MNAPVHSPSAVHPDDTVRGAAILDALVAARVEFVAALPDITTVEGLLKPLTRGHAELRLIRLCKEDEGIGICAGLSYTDRRAVLLMQSTGLLDSINAVRAVACEYELPIVMVVGLIGKERDRAPSDSANLGVRVVEPILDTMGVRHVLIETSADVAKIAPAIEHAYQHSQAVAILIGRSPRIE